MNLRPIYLPNVAIYSDTGGLFHTDLLPLGNLFQSCQQTFIANCHHTHRPYLHYKSITSISSLLLCVNLRLAVPRHVPAQVGRAGAGQELLERGPLGPHGGGVAMARIEARVVGPGEDGALQTE